MTYFHQVIYKMPQQKMRLLVEGVGSTPSWPPLGLARLPKKLGY